MKFNSKGQAFSVFQLLIAAIVAVAILAILFGVLGGISPIGTGEPTTAAGELLKSANGTLGAPKTSGDVVFKKDEKLTARSVTQKAQVGIDYSELIFLTGDFPTKFAVGATSAQGQPLYSLDYTGTSSTTVKLWALCDTGDILPTELSTFRGNDTSTSGWSISTNLDPQTTYCVIAPQGRGR